MHFIVISSLALSPPLTIDTTSIFLLTADVRLCVNQKMEAVFFVKTCLSLDDTCYWHRPTIFLCCDWPGLTWQQMTCPMQIGDFSAPIRQQAFELCSS